MSKIEKIELSSAPHFIQWRAIYSDGTYLDQQDARERQIGYEGIDRSRLVAFALLRNGESFLTIKLDPGQRLIWRKREFHRMDGKHDVVHLAGWQQTVNGQNVQSILYIFEDGRIEMGGAWKDKHALYGSPILTEQER